MNWGGSNDTPVWIRRLIAITHCSPGLPSNKNVMGKEAEQEWDIGLRVCK